MTIGLTESTSLWDGLSRHVLGYFYRVEKSGDSGTVWTKSAAEPTTVKAAITEAELSVTLNWQSPFENAGAEARMPTLASMMQTGEMSKFVDALTGDQTAEGSKVSQYFAQYEGRTGITKLNSTQVFNGMPPVRITCTALFRAWLDAQSEVCDPVDQLMAWALPQELAVNGSILARAAESARNENSGLVETVMPSLSPYIIGFTYKRRSYLPMVIESIELPLSSPVNAQGLYVSMPVSLTLCSLTAIDRTDWSDFTKLIY